METGKWLIQVLFLFFGGNDVFDIFLRFNFSMKKIRKYILHMEKNSVDVKENNYFCHMLIIIFALKPNFLNKS